MCPSKLLPKAPGPSKAQLRAQEAEAERQRQAEQERRLRDKKKQLATRQSERRGSASLTAATSLFNPVASAAGRSFFSPTGGN